MKTKLQTSRSQSRDTRLKKITTALLLTTIIGVNAQVIIGDATGTAATKTSVLLEFAAGQNKGLIVPYVRELPSGAALVGGTIVLDAVDATKARMKFYAGADGWKDLSGQAADISTALADQPLTPISENNAKAIIGASTSTADGVLVLESNTKAMVLPTVADVQDIINPSPGMMVFINKSGAKRLAVYNGSKWSFWKP